jgi:hypothetical protein
MPMGQGIAPGRGIAMCGLEGIFLSETLPLIAKTSPAKGARALM